MNIEQRTNLARNQLDIADRWRRIEPRLSFTTLTGIVFDKGKITFVTPNPGKGGRPQKHPPNT